MSVAGERVDAVISPAPAAPRRLADKALETTAENPWPVRLLSAKIAGYVDRMAPVWVEGQVVQPTGAPAPRWPS